MMRLLRRGSKPDAKEAAAEEEDVKKKKMTAKEKAALEKELRRSMPSRAQVTRNGVFEFTGPLAYTFAVGAIPGGPFVPVDIVLLDLEHVAPDQ